MAEGNKIYNNSNLHDMYNINLNIHVHIAQFNYKEVLVCYKRDMTDKKIYNFLK